MYICTCTGTLFLLPTYLCVSFHSRIKCVEQNRHLPSRLERFSKNEYIRRSYSPSGSILEWPAPISRLAGRAGSTTLVTTTHIRSELGQSRRILSVSSPGLQQVGRKENHWFRARMGTRISHTAKEIPASKLWKAKSELKWYTLKWFRPGHWILITPCSSFSILMQLPKIVQNTNFIFF